MPSGSSSRNVSTKTVASLVLAFASAAAFAAVASASPPNPDIVRANGAGRAPARSAWRPLADLYASRSLSGATLTGDSSDATPAAPPAANLAERTRGAKNPRKALMLSMLMPGAGELYSGHKGRATGFFISEGAIWANFAAWEIAGRLRKDNYIEQAQLNAGIGTGSESDDYWRLVGVYSRSSGSGPDSYEDALRRDARNEFPSDPAAQDAWVAQRLPTGNRAWNWTSASLQENYLDTRQSSTRAYHRAKFSFALAILNRLASAIDTQMLHRGDSKAERSEIGRNDFQILTGMTAEGGGRILLRRTF
jgi:hypothetical protein